MQDPKQLKLRLEVLNERQNNSALVIESDIMSVIQQIKDTVELFPLECLLHLSILVEIDGNTVACNDPEQIGFTLVSDDHTNYYELGYEEVVETINGNSLVDLHIGYAHK